MTNETRNPDTSMRELLELRAAETPDKTFLLSERDGRKWTYVEFDAAVNRTADMLAAHGAGRGDVVSLLLPNSAEYIIAYFACFKTGALAGPVNSLLKAEEAAYVVGNSDAKLLLYHSQFRDTATRIRTEVSSLNAALEFDDVTIADASSGPSPRVGSWRELALGRDDEAIIIYTSGTTGKPKGCLLTHGNLLANARQIVRWLNFTPADRLLSVMPLFHMNAV
ncbi:MAG TPA: class I adenylate-forming enzyme family protein, partial [Pyrinomonadaceae bacterium]